MAILPLGNPDRYDLNPLLARLTEVEKVATFYIGTYQGQRVAVSSSKLGAPAAALAMDVLSMTAVRRVWAIGLCGGLRETVACGDLVIPDSAFGDEGTSRHYGGATPARADSAMVEQASTRVRDAGWTYHVGPLWTTDAILCETDEKIASWNAQGMLGVDMETAAVFAVADAKQLRAAALLVASDNPFMRRTTDYPAIKRGYANAIELLFSGLL